MGSMCLTMRQTTSNFPGSMIQNVEGSDHGKQKPNFYFFSFGNIGRRFGGSELNPHSSQKDIDSDDELEDSVTSEFEFRDGWNRKSSSYDSLTYQPKRNKFRFNKINIRAEKRKEQGKCRFNNQKRDSEIEHHQNEKACIDNTSVEHHPNKVYSPKS